MAKRPKAATVDIGLRVKEPLHARIERAAKDAGVSMNTAITTLLESAFTREETVDRMFGGRELRRMATLWAATFERGAEFGARLDRKEPDPKEFTNPKTQAYRQGALALLQAVTLGMSADDVVLFIESFKGRFLSNIANKQRKGEDRS